MICYYTVGWLKVMIMYYIFQKATRKDFECFHHLSYYCDQILDKKRQLNEEFFSPLTVRRDVAHRGERAWWEEQLICGANREAGAQLDFSTFPFFSVWDPAQVMVLSTFRVDSSSLVKSGNSLKDTCRSVSPGWFQAQSNWQWMLKPYDRYSILFLNEFFLS